MHLLLCFSFSNSTKGIWNLFDRIFPKNDLKMVTICLGIAWIGLAGLQLLVWLTNVIILDVPNRFHPQESVVKQQQRFWSSRKERVKKFARFVCSHVVHQVIYYIGLVIGVLLWKGVWDLASFQVLSGELFQDVLTHVIPLAILCLTGHLADGCGPAPFFSSDEKGRLRVLIGPDLAVETAELFSDILAPNMCDVHSDQESMISINMQRLPRRTTDTSDESSSPVEFDRTCPATIVSFPSTESLLQSHNKKAISLPGEARTTTSTSSSSTTPPHASRTSSEKSRLNSTYNSGTSDTEGVKTRDNPKSAYRTFDRSTTKAQTVPHEASSLRSIIKQNERNTSGTTPPTSASSRNLSPSNKSAAMPIYPPTSKEGLDDTKNVKSSPDLASEERKSVNKPPNT
uniref:Uncharacterized protein n=1 Tax=Percolomonas cosmopolitus TaxID=63605 RepID=A0A7S1KQI8_9EUKA|mmetsp:Transcript_5089/g.19080  ORF Transcript_5089/g.19080 Transcript_5089/m.19080 type:complete len:400 (+) Transcript_5089:530-1729(+)